MVTNGMTHITKFQTVVETERFCEGLLVPPDSYQVCTVPVDYKGNPKKDSIFIEVRMKALFQSPTEPPLRYTAEATTMSRRGGVANENF